MKKYFIAALIAVLGIFAALIYAGSRPKQVETPAVTSEPSPVTANTAAKQTAEKKYKVTFIELGSVRCIPCKAMVPIMKEVEERFGKEVKVIFYDVWTAAGQPYAEQYHVMGIPTQVFLDAEGKEFYRHVGFFPKPELFEVLKKQGVKID